MRASLNFLHHQSVSWLRELSFYREELLLMSIRLGEVVQKNNSTDVRAQIESFQNRFTLFSEKQDTLRHEVHAMNDNALNKAKRVPTHIDEKFSSTNDDLQNKMEDFVKGFASLRFEFNKFLSSVL